MEFFIEKFVKPLCYYYTLEATITYGILLCAFAYLIYKFLIKVNIKIDKYFFLAFLPFIIYGGWARALRDHNLGIYSGIIWCSPLIYFIIFFIAFASLMFAVLVERKMRIGYYKIVACIGAMLCIYNLSITTISNPIALLYVASIAGTLGAAMFTFSRFGLLSKINAAIISAHLFDASSTFTALSFFGYYEQHVLPRALISIAGPWVMFPLKFVVILAVLLYLDKYSKENAGSENFVNFIKFVTLILGLALGVRDCLTMTM